MKSFVKSEELTSIGLLSQLEGAVKDRSQFLKSGLFTALVANILWGTSFLASKYTLVSWGPFTASSLRFLLATILIGVGMVIVGRKIQRPSSLKDWKTIFYISLAGFGFLYPLQLTGLKHINSGMSAAVMLTSPLFVLIFGQLFFNDRLTARKLGAIALGIFGGIILLSSNGKLDFSNSSEASYGAILTLGASICLALSVLVTRKASKIVDSASLTFWSMLIGFVLLATSAQIFENQSILTVFKSSTPTSLMALAFLSCVCSAFCFFIWNYSLTKASPKEIASTMHIKTPTAVLLGVLIAGETIKANLIMGTVVVMCGVILSQTGTKEKAS